MTGPSQGGRLWQGDKAWSKDPKSALFEILQDKELIFKNLTSNIQFQNYLTRKK